MLARNFLSHGQNKTKLKALILSLFVAFGISFPVIGLQNAADDYTVPQLSAGRTAPLPALLNNIKTALTGPMRAGSVDDSIVAINSFSTQYVSGGTMLANSQYVWTPSGSAPGHWFVFRVNYAASTRGDVPAETIKIAIPKSILNDKQGRNADYYEMSLPKRGEENSNDEYAYYEDGDNLVIYNTKTIAAVDGYFEVAYVTDDPTFSYRDMEKSDDFTATIQAGSLPLTPT